MRYWLISIIIFLLILSSCSVDQKIYTTTMEDQISQFHKIIEDSTADQNANGKYKSLGFSSLNIYKPKAFHKLDSLYALKEDYLNKKDYRGLKESQIEEIIPGYKAEAELALDQVQYEMEHIYQVDEIDSINIHHAFYTLNYQHEITNITPIYQFKIAKENQELFYKYQFNLHFLTNSDLYISSKEIDFLQYFKARENQLIYSQEIEKYMNHVMNLIEAASAVRTTDFNNLSKYLIIQDFKNHPSAIHITIEEFSQLFMIENDSEQLLNYEMEVTWSNDETEELIKSTYILSPYLEIEGVSHTNIP